MFKNYGVASIRLAGALTATILASGLPASALANSWMVSGTQCAAYNNTQADLLERNHVRIYNPPTSSGGIYVVCPLTKDYNTQTTNPSWYPFIYFNNAATVTCTFREFNYNATHVPGGTTSGVVQAQNLTITPPATVPGVNWSFGSLPTNTTGTISSYTATCLLPPGTGINSFWLLD